MSLFDHLSLTISIYFPFNVSAHFVPRGPLFGNKLVNRIRETNLIRIVLRRVNTNKEFHIAFYAKSNLF